MSDITLQDPALTARDSVAVSPASVGDYIALLKPRVMSLVVFTGLVGMLIAPGTIHPFIGLTAILAIALGAGASGAINMWFDADIDAEMERTKSRPIPSGRVSAEDALIFGVVIAAGSVLIMGLLVNPLAGALLAVSWRPAGPGVQAFFVGNMAWMAATVGLLFAQLPMRLCNAYLQDDQRHTGYGLVLLAMITGGAWLLSLRGMPTVQPRLPETPG